MGALFDDAAFLEYQYLVELEKRQYPVRNDQGCPVIEKPCQVGKYLFLGARVDGAKAVIKYDQPRILDQSACYGYTLFLTATEGNATFSYHGGELIMEVQNFFFNACVACSLPHKVLRGVFYAKQ